MYREIIIVAYRPPISFRPLKKGEKASKSELVYEPVTRQLYKREENMFGGLVSAMTGLLEEGGSSWVGIGRKHETNLTDEENRKVYTGKKKYTGKSVFFSSQTQENTNYAHFCNGTLWPLFHMIDEKVTRSKTFPKPEFVLEHYGAYLSANTKFADAAFEECLQKPRPIWVQDYHLLLAPPKIRYLLTLHYKNNPATRPPIAHFMHIPFPSNEATHFLKDNPDWAYWEQDGFSGSPREELIKAMLKGSDLLGFHILPYVDNFIEVVEHVLPEAKITEEKAGENIYRVIELEGHKVHVKDFPIGVDVERITREVREGYQIDHKQPDFDLQTAIERGRKAGAKIIGGLERMDYTKGILERLEIIEGLLERGQKIRYIGVATRSREDALGYKNLSAEVRKAVERINEKYKPALGFEPVILRREGINPPENYRFMSNADMVMATPIADGMNLVIPEAVLAMGCLPPKERGRIVIGNCGASYVLRDFGDEDGLVRIDPLDTEGSAEKLERLPATNVSDRLVAGVKERMDVSRWKDDQMQALYEVTGWEPS